MVEAVPVPAQHGQWRRASCPGGSWWEAQGLRVGSGRHEVRAVLLPQLFPLRSSGRISTFLPNRAPSSAASNWELHVRVRVH